MKIIQIINNASANIIALTDEGEIYCGFFSDMGPFDAPSFTWRKVPAIPEGPLQAKKIATYAIGRELTPNERAALKKQAVDEARKSAGKK